MNTDRFKFVRDWRHNAKKCIYHPVGEHIYLYEYIALLRNGFFKILRKEVYQTEYFENHIVKYYEPEPNTLEGISFLNLRQSILRRQSKNRFCLFQPMDTKMVNKIGKYSQHKDIHHIYITCVGISTAVISGYMVPKYVGYMQSLEKYRIRKETILIDAHKWDETFIRGDFLNSQRLRQWT